MKKNSGSVRYSGFLTSPGTPEYGDMSAGRMPNSLSSERIALPGNNNKRNPNTSSALIPFNNGKALPSKWDDAERWITSPISGDPSVRKSVSQTVTKPKSKSGPLGPPGYVYWSQYSPNLHGNSRKLVANSEGSDVAAETKSDDSVPCFQDGKLNGVKYEEMVAPKDSYSRDMATQMSKQGSACSSSSSRGRLSVSGLPFSNGHSKVTRAAKDDIRDVQVDKGITDARKQEHLTALADSLPWSDSRNTTWLRREEAKITAWENLQKAKAEAAIRKLEMNLESKRSSSTDRILTKLSAAHMKAQDMRNSLSGNHAPQNRRTSNASVSCCVCIKWHRNL